MNITADYSPGSRIYNELTALYGADVADAAAWAAFDDDRAALTEIIANARSGTRRTGTSTLGNFWHQITTDPLAAPLDSANNQIGKAVLNILKNPWVLLALAAAVFYLIGGFDWVKRHVAKA
jgi:hypothetical protein